MKILAFAASNSSQSINRELIAYTTRLLTEGPGDVTVDTIDINDYEMPIYSIDRETENGIPRQAHDFFDAISAADGLVISLAEHNGLYTAAYKNLFDWASRIDMRVYQDKPSVMLATSPGPGGGGNVLQTAVTSAPFFGNEIVASLSIPAFHDNFDTSAGSLSNPEYDGKLRAAIADLVAGIEAAADDSNPPSATANKTANETANKAVNKETVS